MELETAAATIEVSDSGIVIRWSDGARSRFHSLWLRNNCSTAVSVTELNPDVWVMDAFRNDDGDLEIEFSDGHETTFGFDWIRAHSHEAHDRRGRPRLITHVRAGHDFDRFDRPMPGSTGHCDLLESVAQFGAAIVTGANDLTELAGRDVDVEYLPGVSLTLAPHTNAAHLYDPPALIFVSDADGRPEGGDVLLVDGFGIAADLYEDSPDVFDALAETSIPFRESNSSLPATAHGPVISLDRDHEVAGIRFDEASIAPLDLEPGITGDYYRSLITFAEEVNDPGRAVQVHLAPDEVLVFDNHRMLHGAAGFDDLQRAAISRDEFHGVLRQLRQKHKRPNQDERLPPGVR